MAATATASKPASKSKQTVFACTVDREALLKILRPIADFLPTKAVSKMAACMLLALTRSGDTPALTLTSARSRESAAWSIPTDVSEFTVPGKVCVNGRKLLQMVLGLKSKEIAITSDSHSLKLMGTAFGCNSSFELEYFDPDEFIGNFTVNEPVTLHGTVKADRLALALNRTVWCAEYEAGSPYCDGVLFDFARAELTLAATNNRRLSTALVGPLVLPERAERSADPERIIVLTRDSVTDLLALLPPGSVDVAVSASRGWLEISHESQTGKMRARFNLIDHKFPDFWKIIPKRDLSRAVVFNGNQLARQMRLMEPFVDGGFRLDIIHSDIGIGDSDKNGACRAHSILSDVGEATSEIPVIVPAEMEPARMWVVPKLLATLAGLVGDEVFSIFVPVESDAPIRIEGAEGWVVCMSQAVETA